MRSKKFIGWAILFLIMFVGLPTEKKVLADETGNINLSYKVLDSYSDNNTLTLVVQLRAKNLNSHPIYEVVARVIYTFNVSIDMEEIYFGYIDEKETLLSPESFAVIIKVESSDQESPQIETVWQLEYIDKNGSPVMEIITFK